ESYCRGRIAAASDLTEKVSVDAEIGRMPSKLQIGTFYGELRKRGLEYGASFSTIRELWVGSPDSGEAIGRITASPHADGGDSHPFTYATMLDGCWQVFGAAMRTIKANDQPGAFVPRSIRSITLRNLPCSQLWSHATVRMSDDARSLLVRIRAVTEGGEVLADIDGLELRPIGKLTLAKDGRASTTSQRVSE